MFLLIFKNVLLMLILILILHFIIRNKLSDQVLFNKRLLIINDTMRNKSTPGHSETASIIEGKNNMYEAYEKRGDIKTAMVDNLVGMTDSGSGMINQNVMDMQTIETFEQELDTKLPHTEPTSKEKSCGSIPCEDFLKKASAEHQNPNPMKELYDFVFSSNTDSKDSKDGIDRYFPTSVNETAVLRDKTEIDEHHKKVRFQDESNNYPYEVVGDLKEKDSVKGGCISGIDTMEISTYSML